MSVKVRLAKIGKRNAPTYKIVVSNIRDKRNGKFLDILGYYNPSKNPAELELDKEKLDEWVTKGAQVSESVKGLSDGTYEFVPYVRTSGKTENKEGINAETELAKGGESVEAGDEAPAEEAAPEEATVEQEESSA